MAGVFPNEKDEFYLSSREATYPTKKERNIILKSAGGEGKMLVLRRVIKSSPKKKVGSTSLHHPEIFFNHSATILATQKQEEVASTNKKTAKKSFVPPLNIYLRVTGKVPAENWVIWAEFFFCSGFVCGRKKIELPKPFGEKNNKLNYPPEN